MDVDTSANEVETGPSVLSSVGVQHADRPQLSTGGWHSHTGPAKWSWQLGLSLSLSTCRTLLWLRLEIWPLTELDSTTTLPKFAVCPFDFILDMITVCECTTLTISAIQGHMLASRIREILEAFPNPQQYFNKAYLLHAIRPSGPVESSEEPGRRSNWRN